MVASVYLYFNSQLDYGELVEKSLTKFKSDTELKLALESSDKAQQRAGKLMFWLAGVSVIGIAL